MAEWYTDFSEYSTGSAPSDWTERWETTLVAPEVVDTWGEYGDTSLELAGGGTFGWYALSWDDIGSAVGDVDILAKFQVPSTLSYPGRYVSLIARGGGSDGSEDGIVLFFYPYYTEVYGRLYAIVNGSFTWLGSNLYPTSPGSTFWMRLNVTGSSGSISVKAKIWDDASSEPASWDEETTSTASLSTGWVGAGLGDDAAHDSRIDYFSASDSGDAPWPFVAGPECDIACEMPLLEATLMADGIGCVMPMLEMYSEVDVPSIVFDLTLPMFELEAETGNNATASMEMPMLETTIFGGATVSCELPLLEMAGVSHNDAYIETSCVMPMLTMEAGCGGAMVAEMPALVASLGAEVEQIAGVACTLPKLLIEATAEPTRASVIAARMPMLGIGMTTHQDVNAAMALSMPALRAALAGETGEIAQVACTLPILEFAGTTQFSPTADIAMTLPMLAMGGASAGGAAPTTTSTEGRLEDYILRYGRPG